MVSVRLTGYLPDEVAALGLLLLLRHLLLRRLLTTRPSTALLLPHLLPSTQLRSLALGRGGGCLLPSTPTVSGRMLLLLLALRLRLCGAIRSVVLALHLDLLRRLRGAVLGLLFLLRVQRLPAHLQNVGLHTHTQHNMDTTHSKSARRSEEE